MPRGRLLLVVAFFSGATLAFASVSGPHSSQKPPTVVDLLDRYERGDQQGVIAEFATIKDVRNFAGDLQRRGDAWMALAAQPAAIERRRFVLAMFALELAVARFETNWGILRSPLEWACARLRRGETTDHERLWHLAVVALAQGAADRAFVSFYPSATSAFDHAQHAGRRFPTEVRFRFADAVVRQLGLREPPRDAQDAGLGIRSGGLAAIATLKTFVSSPDVGGEAQLRIGHVYFVLRDHAESEQHYREAIRATRDPFVHYLANFFLGRLFDATGRRQDAEDAYRRALAVYPTVQSGSLALAAVLFLDEKPTEAYAVMDNAFAATPRPPDPWRLFGYGDYRLLPERLAELRRLVKP